MEKNEKKLCHHCGKRLKQGHQATMVKEGQKYLLHKGCAKLLQDLELDKQNQGLKGYGSVVINPKDIEPDDKAIDIPSPLGMSVVLQTDARVLREGLAKVFKMVPPPIQQEINNILGLYARNVAVYCQHPEKSFVPMRGCHVCIDCGAGDMGNEDTKS